MIVTGVAFVGTDFLGFYVVCLLSIASHFDGDENILTNLWSIILIFMWILRHLNVGGRVCLCLSRMQKEGHNLCLLTVGM